MTRLAALLPHPTATKDDRSTIIGGTDARVIIEGKDWLKLYNQKLGIEPYPDLTHAWKPRLGLATEQLHAWWHGHATGVTVLDVPDRPMTRPGLPSYAACTLDYWVEQGDVPLELKHTHARNDLRSAAQFYMAQLQWQMFVTDTPVLRFSIIAGNEEPEWGEVDREQEYIDRMCASIDAFWWHITNKEPPETEDGTVGFGGAISAELAAVAKTVKINALRDYDWSTNNAWVSAATKYVTEKPIADGFKETTEALKALIPEDAALIIGGGVQMKRASNGAKRLTITE